MTRDESIREDIAKAGSCQVRRCNGSNAFCRACDHESLLGKNPSKYGEPPRGQFKKGELVLEITIESPSGWHKSLMCRRHAMRLLKQLQEEVKKFE